LARSVTGIDIFHVAVNRATVKATSLGLSSARFVVGNAETLEPFDDGSFDLVFGSAILHHLTLDRAYANIARVRALARFVTRQWGVGDFLGSRETT
jgi:ubiquinone/menaquinone biosynthesis C-methylase UbiE